METQKKNQAFHDQKQRRLAQKGPPLKISGSQRKTTALFASDTVDSTFKFAMCRITRHHQPVTKGDPSSLCITHSPCYHFRFLISALAFNLTLKPHSTSIFMITYLRVFWRMYQYPKPCMSHDRSPVSPLIVSVTCFDDRRPIKTAADSTKVIQKQLLTNAFSS
jgi:hypothetical protein